MVRAARGVRPVVAPRLAPPPVPPWDGRAPEVPRLGDIPSICRLIPGYDPWGNTGGALFDPKLARRAIAWFHAHIQHVAGGAFAGKPLILSPWQQAIIGNVYGWRMPDGTRRYRVVPIFVGRKNGKSAIASAWMVKLITDEEEKEAGAQIYSLASTVNQANLVFHPAKAMVARCPRLACKVRLWEKSITRVDDQIAFYKPVAADSDTAQGFSPSGYVIDEFHTQPNRRLYDAMLTGRGARRNPLSIYITTAGWDRESICYEVYEDAKHIRDGNINDFRTLPVVYEVPDADDWNDPGVWYKANPNLGVSITMEDIREEHAKAKRNPSYENTFRQYYCNQWTSQAVRWISMNDWDACADRALKIDAFEGEQCWGGLDLAFTRDLSAFTLVFRREEHFYLFAWHWMPAGKAREQEESDHVPYALWQRQGLIEFTPTPTTDFSVIERTICQQSRRFDLRSVGYDGYGAATVATNLIAEGIDMVKIQQGWQGMSEPAKLMERLVLERKLWHDGNALLRRQVDNATVTRDRNENLYVHKPGARKRIDAVIAGIMSIKLASLDPDAALGGDRYSVSML